MLDINLLREGELRETACIQRDLYMETTQSMSS